MQQTLLVFDAYTRECVGQWVLASNCNMTYGGNIKDVNGLPRLMVVSGTNTDVSLYYQRAESDASVWLDSLVNGTTQDVALSVTSPKVAGDPQIAKLFTRLDLTSQNESGTAATLQAAYQGARSTGFTSPANLNAVAVTSGFPNHWSRGLDLRGRWAQVRITNTTNMGTRATVGQLQIEGIATQDSLTGVA